MRKEEGVKNTGIEIGLYTLGDIGPDPHNGRIISTQPAKNEGNN